MMLGRELAETTSKRAASRSHEMRSECASFAHIGKAGTIAPFDLTLHHGQVIGLASLLGSGRTETARFVFGAERVDSGEVKVEGRVVRLHSPRDAVSRRAGAMP